MEIAFHIRHFSDFQSANNVT